MVMIRRRVLPALGTRSLVFSLRSATRAVLFAHVFLHGGDLNVAEHDRQPVQHLGVEVVCVLVTHGDRSR